MDEPKIRLQNGPYVEPRPKWNEILAQGYLKSMDYFHANFEIKPQAPSWRGGGIQMDTVTTHTRVVVWTHAEKPTLIMVFGEHRTLVKAIDEKRVSDEANLDELIYEIDSVVEDTEREAERGWS